MLKIYFFWQLWILLPVMAVDAGEIYRWIDKDGRVHYSDSVPEAQKSGAKPLNLPNARFIESDRREAQARLERENKTLQKPSPWVGVAPTTQQPSPGNAESAASDFPSGRRACEAEWRRYRESVECFAPYVNVGGSVKAEAFLVCKEVKMPALCN